MPQESPQAKANRELAERAERVRRRKAAVSTETFRPGIKIPPKKAGRPKFGKGEGNKGETIQAYRKRVREWEKTEAGKEALKPKE